MEQTRFIAEPWNAGFINVAERPLVPRDYLYASELGNAPIDIYMRLRAIAPTNPPNERARRKMGAGVDFEYAIKRILNRAGILIGQQVEAKHQLEGCLRVSGKLDFLIGGVCDETTARAYVEGNEELSPNFRAAIQSVMTFYKKKYPQGFEPKPDEYKTIATFGMDKMEITRKPIRRHALQLYHYLVSLNYPEGVLTYVCRDDYRMMEFVVRLDDLELKADYENAVHKLSEAILKDVEPEKEKLIMFDTEVGKFTKNLNVEYSNYLTKLYGFQEPREYSEIYGRKATSWNGVLKRIRESAKMTDKNDEYILEAAKMGFNMMKLAEDYKINVEVEEEA